MRTGATQSSPTAEAQVILLFGADQYSTADVPTRIVDVTTNEQIWGSSCEILLDNSDAALDSKNYVGVYFYIYWGFVGITGSNAPGMWVESQQFISKEGKLLMKLICKDQLVKLASYKGTVGGSVWNHPWQSLTSLAGRRLQSGQNLPAALVTAINAQYDKTALQIVSAVLLSTTGDTIVFTPGGAEDDGLIGTEKPQVVGYDARDILQKTLTATNSYIRCVSAASTLEIIYPAGHGVVYSYSSGNLHFNNTWERTAVVPNKIVFHGLTTANALISTAAGQGEDTASIALLGQIVEHNDYDYFSRENSRTQAIVNSKANRRLAKLQLSLGTGMFVAPMHCAQELLDKVTIVDDRYTTPKTVTGYVWAMKREYSRGIYRITVQLGGVETGAAPEGEKPFSVSNPPIQSNQSSLGLTVDSLTGYPTNALRFNWDGVEKAWIACLADGTLVHYGSLGIQMLGKVINRYNVVTDNNTDLGSTTEHWNKLWANYIYKVAQNDAVTNLMYDIYPYNTISWIGNSLSKFDRGYFTSLPTCPEGMPSVDSGIAIMKKIKKPKADKNFHLMDSDAPDEMKVPVLEKVHKKVMKDGKEKDTVEIVDTGEKEIDYIKTIGVLTRTVMELVEKVEALESKGGN
jgi:hypothetical protein